MGISRWCATRYQPHYVEYVYSLRHPVTLDIYYIGKTNQLAGRFYAHCNKIGYNAEKDAITEELIAQRRRPIMRVIDQTEVRTDIDRFHAEYKEAYWIQKYLAMGWKLTNKQWVGSDLNNTDYMRKYVEWLVGGKEVPLERYYFAQDEFGDRIYDRKRRLKDGFTMPVEETLWQIPKQVWRQEYNPMTYHRFAAKIGTKIDWDDSLTYHPIYKDTDPNYYDDDY